MNRLRLVLEMIKFEHTVFALPFAFLGAFLAAHGFPGWRTSVLVILAMAGARSCAMAFNRLVDLPYDSANPRTSGRALPRGLVSRFFVAVFAAISAGIFVVAAWMLNELAFYLSPLALFIVLGYSYTKRFTTLSHLFLGLSLGIAPVGGWIAVTGAFAVAPLVLAGAVMFWVAGFDIIYACQDIEFDRRTGLYSIPSRFGIKNSLRISAIFHWVMIVLLLLVFAWSELSAISWLGLLFVGLALVYEHRLVKPNDLSKVNAAFFTVNGVVSLALLVFVGIDLCLFA